MLSHQEMIGLQAEKHELIDEDGSVSPENFVLHLIHASAYEHAARMVSGKSVLDIGCNTGYGTNILAKRARTVSGIDVSERAIAMAESKYSSDRMEFRTVDGNQIPYKAGAFDVVTCFQVIEHLVEYESFVNEVKRVLAPHGVVIFTTPNSLLRLDPGMKPWNEFHVREFDPKELAAAVQTFFGEVCILGLRADDPLRAIEVNRVDRARRMARVGASNSQRVTAGGAVDVLRMRVRSNLKKVLPSWVLSKRREFQTPTSRRLLRALRDDHGVRDFYYETSGLDDALDFMAICSDVDITRHVESVLAPFSRS